MLVKFVQYINWRNLSDTAGQPTTRGVAEQAIKIKKGTEQLSANIVKDAQEQLNRISGELQHSLKELTTYYREWYKLQVRLNVLGKEGVPAAPQPEQYDAAAKKVRAAFPGALPGQPFARELILEIFAENAADGQAARETLLNSLRVPEAEVKEQKSEQDLKPILLDAARALAGTSRSLEEAAHKLEDNALVLESRKLSFGEMLKQVWDHIRGRDQEVHVYVVDYLDEGTNMRQTDEVQFEPFIAAVRKRARLYGSIMSKSGPAWKKLEASDEDAVLQFVTKDTQEVNTMVRRLSRWTPISGRR